MRNFVKHSLMHVFPDKHDEILENVDVGEYGLEDYWCRLTAVFIFSLAMMEEMLNIARTLLLLSPLPATSESWISYDGPLQAGDSEPITHKSEVKLKIAGM